MGDIFGGGAEAPPPRSLRGELGDIFKVFRRQELPLYRQFARREPLLSGARELALQGPGQLPALEQTLSGAYGQLPAVSQLQGTLSRAYGQLPATPELMGMVRSAYGQAVPTPGLTGPLFQTYQQQITPVLQSGGALTPQMARDVTQQTRAGFAARGNVLGNQALGRELLNRDIYRQQRYNQALQQGMGVTGAISGLDTAALQRGLGAATGLQQLGGTGLQQALGYASGLQQLGGTGLQHALGYTQGLQGLREAPIANMLRTQQAQTGSFGNLLAPTMGYGQDLFNTNYNAQAAANIANANKGAGTMSSIGSTLGMLGAAAMMSDERLKEKIRKTGKKTPEGIPIKTFAYRDGSGRRFRGVTAQDVEKIRPEAIIILPITGHKLVDMSLIDAPFEEVTKHAS
jgi:hypothetical protein